MKLVMVVEGTVGDVQPVLSLVRCLAANGHTVALCSSLTRFREVDGEMVLERRPAPELPAGCEFVRLPMWRSDVFKETLKAAASQDTERMFPTLGSWFATMCEDSIDQVIGVIRRQAADVFLTGNHFLLHVIHEACDIPCCKIILQPQMATSAFPPMSDSTWMDLTQTAVERKVSLQGRVPPSEEFFQAHVTHANRIAEACLDIVNGVRSRLIKPPPPRLSAGTDFWDWMEQTPFKTEKQFDSSTPMKFAIQAFSPGFLEKGFSYGSRAPMVGPFMDSEADCKDHQAPEDLTKFLKSCARAPVYIGFGSMSLPNAATWTKLAVTALRSLDSQGKHVIGSGWAGLSIDNLKPEDQESIQLHTWAKEHVFFVKEYVPHCWLFPYCDMAVHHGGAGTTHAIARAGIPQVIVPLLADQPFWGLAVEDKGVGVRMHKYLSDDSLTAHELCDAMKRARTPEVREAALGLQQEMMEQGDSRVLAMKFLQSVVDTKVES